MARNGSKAHTILCDDVKLGLINCEFGGLSRFILTLLNKIKSCLTLCN